MEYIIHIKLQKYQINTINLNNAPFRHETTNDINKSFKTISIISNVTVRNMWRNRH